MNDRPDLHALSGAYALDALDDNERAAFETHLARCEECQREVRELRETATLLLDEAPIAPPAGQRDAVLAAISQVRPLPPLTAPTPLRPRRAWLTRMPILAAAAAVVLIALGGLVWQPWQQQPASTYDRVLAAGDAARMTMTTKDGTALTVVTSPSVGRTVLLDNKLPQPPAGKTYQLWLQDARGNMHAAGITAGRDPVLLAGSSADSVGVGVTVEPAGGSAQPTAAPIALGEFKDAA